MERNATLDEHRCSHTCRNPMLHKALALTPARESAGRVISVSCLVFRRLLKGLMDAADERRLQLFLPLSFAIHHPSIFSFHSPAPLLLSHTSLPLSFFEPTNLLLLPPFSDLISSGLSGRCPLPLRSGWGFCCSSSGLMIIQCAAKGCLTDLSISRHSFTLKRDGESSYLAQTGRQIPLLSHVLHFADGGLHLSSIRLLTWNA